MKTSLTTGEWGSFTAPRSRALGGKSGMTRATPLVLIRPRPLHFADCLHLVFLALLSAFLWYASLPSFERPQVPSYTQEQPCLIEQKGPFREFERWMKQEKCEPLTHPCVSRRSRDGFGCVGGAARRELTPAPSQRSATGAGATAAQRRLTSL